MKATSIERLLRLIAADDPNEPLIPSELADAMGIGEGLSVEQMARPADGAPILMLRLRYGTRCLTHVMDLEQGRAFARDLLNLANTPASRAPRKGAPS